MNAYELLAFVIISISLAGLGWAVALIFTRHDRQKHNPAGE